MREHADEIEPDPYAWSKEALIVWTMVASARPDWRSRGIRINAVCPGIIGNTPMAATVTKNYDPDIMKAFVAAQKITSPGWFTGDNVNTAIGQETMLVTPMQSPGASRHTLLPSF